jgi:hypothetical protein
MGWHTVSYEMGRASSHAFLDTGYQVLGTRYRMYRDKS